MERLRISITGIVQGVGFRPFVYNLARRHNLSGWVANDASGVIIEAEGTDARGRAFERTGAAGVVSERGGARLLPGSVRAEWTGEADARVLRVTARASVREPGDYRLAFRPPSKPCPGFPNGSGRTASPGGTTRSCCLPSPPHPSTKRPFRAWRKK